MPFATDKNFFKPGAENVDILILADSTGDMVLDVYNIVAEKVRRVDFWQGLAATGYTRVWDGRNDRGEFVGNGVYLLVLRSPAGVRILKVIVLK